MKTFRIILSILLLAGTLSSCLDNDKADIPALIALTTTHVSDSSPRGYYFSLDNGKTIYPGDISRIGSYDTSERDGKRAIVFFTPMDEAKDGFDYNAALYEISNVLTKKIETADTEEQLDLFGNDPIDIRSARISGGFLDIYYNVSTNGMNTIKHRLSLVNNTTVTPPTETPEGYIYLEFYHHADGDLGNLSAYGYVSYELENYDPATTQTKGIYLKFTHLSGKTKYIKLEPTKEEK